MDIYLAGGISGNCKPMWINLIKAHRGGKLDLYLAGTASRHWIVDEHIRKGENMDLYLAETAPWKEEGIYNKTIETGVKILESFFYSRS